MQMHVSPRSTLQGAAQHQNIGKGWLHLMSQSSVISFDSSVLSLNSYQHSSHQHSSNRIYKSAAIARSLNCAAFSKKTNRVRPSISGQQEYTYIRIHNGAWIICFRPFQNRTGIFDFRARICIWFSSHETSTGNPATYLLPRLTSTRCPTAIDHLDEISPWE